LSARFRVFSQKKKEEESKKKKKKQIVVGGGSGDLGCTKLEEEGKERKGFVRKDLNETKQIYGFSSSRHKNNRWILFVELRFLFKTTEERRGRETRRRDFRKRRLKEEKRRRRRRRRVEGL
jgi:hypothetical protein